MCTTFRESCLNEAEQRYLCISWSAMGWFKKPPVALGYVVVLLHITYTCYVILGVKKAEILIKILGTSSWSKEGSARSEGARQLKPDWKSVPLLETAITELWRGLRLCYVVFSLCSVDSPTTWLTATLIQTWQGEGGTSLTILAIF